MGSRIYDRPTTELVKTFAESFIPQAKKQGFGLVERKSLKDGGYFSHKEALDWFQKHYPKLKRGTVSAHLRQMSTNAPSRIHHNVHSNGQDDLLFQIDRSRFRLYDKNTDPFPIYIPIDNGTDDDEDESETVDQLREFAYEEDLKKFLVKNLEIIKPSLTLYKDDDITGVEFPVGGRFIDILAVDGNGNLVVIELKVSKGYDRVIGQLLRYMRWIEKDLADKGQSVKGMIIARDISTDLRLASSKIPGVELFEYDLSVTLREIEAI